jgi:hypothetical protein
MSAGRISVALKRYREAIEAAELQLERTRAEHLRAIAVAERCRDAAVLLAEARYLKVLDAERDTCTHDRIEDGAAGVIGCCAAPVAAGAQ